MVNLKGAVQPTITSVPTRIPTPSLITEQEQKDFIQQQMNIKSPLAESKVEYVPTNTPYPTREHQYSCIGVDDRCSLKFESDVKCGDVRCCYVGEGKYELLSVDTCIDKAKVLDEIIDREYDKLNEKLRHLSEQDFQKIKPCIDNIIKEYKNEPEKAPELSWSRCVN